MQLPAERRAQQLRQEGLDVPDASTCEGLKGKAFDSVQQKAAKLLSRKRQRQEDTARGQPKPKKTKQGEAPPQRWAEQRREAQDRAHPLPGLAVLDDPKGRAGQILQRCGFKVMSLGSDPGAGAGTILQEGLRLSARKNVTHMVTCQALAKGNCGLEGALARVLGAFFCSVGEVAKVPKNGPSGIQFRNRLGRQRSVFLQDADAPHLKQFLESAASCPGSRLSVVPRLKDLQRAYKKYVAARGPRSRPWTQMRALVPEAVMTKALHVEYPNLCCAQGAFFDFLCDGVDRDAVAPGEW